MQVKTKINKIYNAIVEIKSILNLKKYIFPISNNIFIFNYNYKSLDHYLSTINNISQPVL